MGLFIHDGWTCKGRVAAVPGLHPAVCFTYRPATPRLRYEMMQAEPAERFNTACSILCRLLVSVQVEGEPDAVKLVPAQAEQMPADVFQQMFDAVMCYVGPNLPTEGAEKN